MSEKEELLEAYKIIKEKFFLKPKYSGLCKLVLDLYTSNRLTGEQIDGVYADFVKQGINIATYRWNVGESGDAQRMAFLERRIKELSEVKENE